MPKTPRTSRSRYSTQPVYRSSMARPTAPVGLPLGGFVNAPRRPMTARPTSIPPVLTPVDGAPDVSGLPRHMAGLQERERAGASSAGHAQGVGRSDEAGRAGEAKPRGGPLAGRYDSARDSGRSPLSPAALLVSALVAASVVGCASHGGAYGAGAGGSSGSGGASALSQAASNDGCLLSQVVLEPRSGSSASGTLDLKQCGTTLSIEGDVRGLTPNQLHGFHAHEKGDCSAPDATSAGGHFNPDAKPHGPSRTEAARTHAGDFGNIASDANGVARVTITSTELTLRQGPLAVDTRAFVVHAKADDLRTQPSGDSGGRIACGVVMAKAP